MNLRSADRIIRTSLIALMCAMGAFGLASWASHGGISEDTARSWGWPSVALGGGDLQTALVGAARKPLVIVAGQTEQIQTADYLSVVGGMTTNATAASGAGDFQTTTETVSSTFADQGQLTISGAITPTAFGGTRVDNYNPTGLATTYVIDQQATSATVITGLTAQPAGTQIDFRNIASSAGSITFSNADTNSLAANRFTLPGAVNWILPPGNSVLLRYNGTDWRMVAIVTSDVPSLTIDTTFLDNGQFSVSGSITPASFGGTRVDNYAPTGLSTTFVIDQQATSATTITGLTAQPTGTLINFRNAVASVASITFSNGDTNSLAANRFNLPGAVNWILPAGSSILMRYSGTDWRMVATTTTDLPSLTVDGTSTLKGATTVGQFVGTTEAGTTTGTQNNWALGATTTIFRWNGNANSIYTGFQGGVDGRLLIINNLSGHTLTLNNLDAGSTASNQLQNEGNVTVSLVGNNSSATYVYDGTTAVWRMITFTSTQVDFGVTFKTTTTGTTFSGATVSMTTSIAANGTASHYRSIIGSSDTVTSCGSAPSPTILATDAAGKIKMGGSATACTIAWTTAYTTNIPSCIVTFEDVASIAYTYTPSLTNLVVTAASGAGHTFDYFCVASI